jgi:hypothetical protein
MIDAARDVLIRRIREDATLFSTISGRIYPGDLASVINPTYPCMTVKFQGGVPDEYNTDLGDGSVLIQYYSTKSYSDCWTMYKQTKSIIDFQVFSDSEVTIRLTKSGLPFERFDQESRIYILTDDWNVFMIGA